MATHRKRGAHLGGNHQSSQTRRLASPKGLRRAPRRQSSIVANPSTHQSEGIAPRLHGTAEAVPVADADAKLPRAVVVRRAGHPVAVGKPGAVVLQTRAGGQGGEHKDGCQARAREGSHACCVCWNIVEVCPQMGLGGVVRCREAVRGGLQLSYAGSLSGSRAALSLEVSGHAWNMPKLTRCHLCGRGEMEPECQAVATGQSNVVCGFGSFGTDVVGHVALSSREVERPLCAHTGHLRNSSCGDASPSTTTHLSLAVVLFVAEQCTRRPPRLCSRLSRPALEPPPVFSLTEASGMDLWHRLSACRQSAKFHACIRSPRAPSSGRTHRRGQSVTTG